MTVALPLSATRVDAVYLLSARLNGLDEIFSNDERLLAAAFEISIVRHNAIP